MKSGKLLCLAPVIILGLIAGSTASNILVILMVGSKSHRFAWDPLIRELAARGHRLTVLSHTQDSRNPNITEIHGPTVHEILGTVPDPYEDKLQNRLMDIFGLGAVLGQVCQVYYEKAEVLALLNVTFDLIMIDANVNECAYGFTWQLRAPYIFLSSTMSPPVWVQTSFGIPSTPSTQPLTFSRYSFKNRMSFLERLWSFLEYLKFNLVDKPKYFKDSETGYRRHFPNAPSIEEASAEASLILSNTHSSIGYPGISQPDVIEIGGMHCRSGKPLPKDIQTFLDGSGPDGFIYLSMGSILPGNQMPDFARRSFVNVFSKLKQRVLWKFETQEGMPNLPPNVMLTKWAPQQDVLGHKNIRLFITHAGWLSIQEAVYHGVPLFSLPMFGDQNANAELIVDKGIGLQLDFIELNEETLTYGINRILNEPSFQKEVKRVSERFRTRMEDPLDLAVFWVEYVIKFEGAAFLRTIARDMNFMQYYCLDVICTLTVILGFLVILMFNLLKVAFRYVTNFSDRDRLVKKLVKAD